VLGISEDDLRAFALGGLTHRLAVIGVPLESRVRLRQRWRAAQQRGITWGEASADQRRGRDSNPRWSVNPILA